MIAGAKGRWSRRTDADTEPEVQGKDEEESRQERGSRPRRRHAALEEQV